jgi:hypothetical protein
MLSAPSYVVQTWYIERNGVGHYRIELSASRAKAARRRVLVTHDPGVYRIALDAEGTDAQLVARWHSDGTHAICDALLPAPAPLPDTERIRT